MFYTMTAEEVARILAADRRPIWGAVPERPWRWPGVVVAQREAVVGGVKKQSTRKIIG